MVFKENLFFYYGNIKFIIKWVIFYGREVLVLLVLRIVNIDNGIIILGKKY